MRRIIWRWELVGALAIALAGSAAHFSFEWTHYWRPAALVFAVNESVWEHLKLAFWPGLLFALVEYPLIRKMTPNFWLAKTLQLFAMPLTIMLLFYAYMIAGGQSSLALGISVFVLAVAAGQIVSYRTLIAPKARLPLQRAAVIGLLLLTLAFSLWTYYPPRLPLFEDPPTHGYGIPHRYGR